MKHAKHLLTAVFVSALAGIFLLTACNGGGGKTLSEKDSIAIYKTVMESKERVFDHLRLSADELRKLFTPKDPTQGDNAVKQVLFTWNEYKTDCWGLKAYGANEKGEPLNDPVDVAYDESDYQTNWEPLERTTMVIRRGDFKLLFGDATRGSNKPITDADYADVVFSLHMAKYPESEALFYDVKKAAEFSTRGILGGSVIYANPSPPYNSVCETECDN